MPHSMCPRFAEARAPFHAASHFWPVLMQETLKHSKAGLVSLCGGSGSWCTQGFVWVFQVSLARMGFGSKCDFSLPTIMLGLLFCPWMWGIFFWWDPTLSCQWLFSSELQFWSSHRTRWVHVLLSWHLSPYRLLQRVQCSCLYSTLGSCWLSILLSFFIF